VNTDSEFGAAALQLAGDDVLRARLGRNAATAKKRLHPQQGVAEFDALLSELATARRPHADHAA